VVNNTIFILHKCITNKLKHYVVKLYGVLFKYYYILFKYFIQTLNKKLNRNKQYAKKAPLRQICVTKS